MFCLAISFKDLVLLNGCLFGATRALEMWLVLKAFLNIIYPQPKAGGVPPTLVSYFYESRVLQLLNPSLLQCWIQESKQN